MLLAMHVDNNRHCIRDGDAFLYEDILHLHTLTQTVHFTLTNIKRTNYVQFFFTCLNELTTINAGKVWLHLENYMQMSDLYNAFGQLSGNELLTECIK